MRRRTLLKIGLVQAVAGAALRPLGSWAAYPAEAFAATETTAALTSLHGTDLLEDSDQLQIDVPGIAEDPRYVPIRISSTLQNIEAVTVIAEGNNIPLSAHFRLFEPQDFIASRIKVEQTGVILVVVKADGRLHAARRTVRASTSGCAG